MLHHVARAAPGRLLFTSWAEGMDLWRRITPRVEGMQVLVLMPDHVHLLHPRDVRQPLAQALAGHSRARQAEHGLLGPGIARLPPAEPVPDADKRRRSLRYVALNPCRARLANDPLAWPLSTYRDSVGLALCPILPSDPDPWELHAYVSGDPSVNVRGTCLPEQRPRAPRPEEVAEAVCALARAPIHALATRGPTREAYLRCAKALCELSAEEIGRVAEVRRHAVYASPEADPAEARRVSRVIGDPRFFALPDGDLRRDPRWASYRSRR